MQNTGVENRRELLISGGNWGLGEVGNGAGLAQKVRIFTRMNQRAHMFMYCFTSEAWLELQK